MSDTSIEPPVGASVWERDLFAHLTEHAQVEQDVLEEYAAAARATDSRALAYLVNLLIEDEQRHHRLFAELARSLKSTSELSAEDPPVPWMDFQRADHATAVELTRRLLTREEDDARELKRLRKELRDVEHTTLWGLLVDLMQRDTDKHIAILRFADQHIKSPQG
ncbi:MAG: hypothetical protein ACYCTL_04865 [Acidimicrobiales bacterium]